MLRQIQERRDGEWMRRKARSRPYDEAYRLMLDPVPPEAVRIVINGEVVCVVAPTRIPGRTAPKPRAFGA